MALPHPHDSFFKELFGRPEITRDFLRHYLPQQVVAHLRLDKIELQDDSFIDPNLQEQYADLLFHVPLVEGESAYVYILFEHKSQFEKLTPFQLLRYMVRIWERNLRLDPGASLPPILPIVYYHRQNAWRAETNFAALYTGPAEFRDYWLGFVFQLMDLTQYTDAELRGEVRLQVGMRLMKHIYDLRLDEEVPRFFDMMVELMSQETGLQYLETLLRYITAVGQNVSEQGLRRALLERFSQQGGAIVGTLAEKWLQQGIEQGIQEGIEQGQQEGQREGAQVMRNGILTILRLRFDVQDQDIRSASQRLSEIVSLEQLEELHAVALRAPSWNEFEKQLRGMQS